MSGYAVPLGGPTSRLGLVAGVVFGALVLGLVAVVQPVLALALALGVIFVAVTLVSLTWGVALFTVLIFLEHVPGVASASLSFIKLAGAVLGVSWLLTVATRDRAAPLLTRDHPVLAYAAVFLVGWAVVSSLWAIDSAQAISTSFRFFQGVLLLFIVYTAVRNRDDLRLLIWAYVAGAAATAVAGLGGGSSAEKIDEYSEVTRFAGQIGDPNELAAMLVPALVFAAFSVVAVRAALGRWALATCGLLFALGLFLTQSRGGIVALAVTLVVSIILSGPVRARAVVVVLVVGALGLTYYSLVAPPEALSRITHFQSGGGTGRPDLWAVSTRMYADHPLIGIGTGQFKLIEPTYALDDVDLARVDLIVDTPKVAHNTYLHVLVELGAIGAIAFGVIIFGALRAAWQAVRVFSRRRELELEVLSRGLMVGTIGMLAAFTFISAQYEKQLWLLLGLTTALSAVARRVEPETGVPAALPASGAEYDRDVSERLVEQLEQRLSERMDALMAEQERLERRRAAIAAREQELLQASRRLEEGHSALAAETSLVDPLPAAAVDDSADVEQRLEQRIKAVTERELAVARRAGPLAELEQRLAAKEAELEAREQRLAQRESVAPVAVSQPESAPVSAPQPAAAETKAPEAGAFTLEALEGAVDSSADRYPDRQDEWGYYLVYLRDYVLPDGTLPSVFDPLIEEVFGELAEQAREE